MRKGGVKKDKRACSPPLSQVRELGRSLTKTLVTVMTNGDYFLYKPMDFGFSA